MKTIFVFLIFLFGILEAHSQFKNNVWCFGDSCGLDFKSGVPVPFTTSVLTRGGSCSISDSSSSLLFYCHTLYYPLWSIGYLKLGVVYNKNNQVMINGDSLYGGAWFQEMVIIPYPKKSNLFLLIHSDITIYGGVYFSVIDINANNGKGNVVQKNVPIDSTLWSPDCIKAIKAGNGQDWWLLFRRINNINNEWIKYKIDSSGITQYPSQFIGTATMNNIHQWEYYNYGTKIIDTDGAGLIELYDFDRCTGTLSNVQTIDTEVSVFWPYYFGLAISPNGRYAYISTTVYPTQHLYQYDLQASNIKASKTLIDSVSEPVQYGSLRLAPDGKIYLACLHNDSSFTYPCTQANKTIYNQNLSVINNPDTAAPYCNFSPFSVWLGGNETYWGLPNNPDYDLGPLVGSACDTLSTSSPPAPQRGEQQLYATYISAWQKLFINAQNLKGRNVTIAIYDARGSLMVQEYKGSRVNAGYFTMNVDCAGWASGLYVVHLQTEKEVLNKKFIKN